MDMDSKITKTQIDRLGDRLRTGTFSDADLRLLDEYRRSFASAYEILIQKIRNRTPEVWNDRIKGIYDGMDHIRITLLESFDRIVALYQQEGDSR